MNERKYQRRQPTHDIVRVAQKQLLYRGFCTRQPSSSLPLSPHPLSLLISYPGLNHPHKKSKNHLPQSLKKKSFHPLKNESSHRVGVVYPTNHNAPCRATDIVSYRFVSYPSTTTHLTNPLHTSPLPNHNSIIITKQRNTSSPTLHIRT